MSVAVAGLWELGWNTPIKEADLWEFMLRDMGVNLWSMAPVSGITGRPVNEYNDMDEIIEANRDGRVIVFVDENGETPLAEFSHPENPLYVFGRVASSPFHNNRRDGDLSVRIETPTDTGTIWPHQIAAILLYHRISQWP